MVTCLGPSCNARACAHISPGIARAPICHQHHQILHRLTGRGREGKYSHVADPQPKYKCFYPLKSVSGMVELLRQSPTPHHCHQADGKLFPLWKDLSSRLENTINIVYLHEVHLPFSKMYNIVKKAYFEADSASTLERGNFLSRSWAIVKGLGTLMAG
ncbi:hypothetical protein C8R45DRAFT_936481 [Mycena sanguinolenta]|nr:hypothetical protein C8R45DRAFT_936481 [Mycena sanguinolenta]